MEEGVLNNGIYWHSIATSLFQGGAIAMAYALVVRLLAPTDWRFRDLDLRLAHGTMVALLAIWNVIFAILAGLTGLYMTWGLEAVTSVTLTVNKAMIGSFGLLALVIMIGVRYRYGPGLWHDPSLRITYALLGFIGSGAAIVTGSLGGEAALLGTVLDWLWRLLNIEPRFPMIMPVWGSVALIVVAVAGVGIALMLRLSGRSRQEA